MNNHENKYTYLFWWVIFILILPWDQEKIVLVNLIVFVYLVRYMFGETIQSTLNQKAFLLTNILQQEFFKHNNIIKTFSSELKSFLSHFGHWVKHLILVFISSLTLNLGKYLHNKTFVVTFINKFVISKIITILKFKFNKNIFIVNFLKKLKLHNTNTLLLRSNFIQKNEVSSIKKKIVNDFISRRNGKAVV